MFRAQIMNLNKRKSFPHASGDVPILLTICLAPLMLSPREWGCSEEISMINANNKAFPTRVGMFRPFLGPEISISSFPHASGAVPEWICRFHDYSLLSPREWGCSVKLRSILQHRRAFPTRVGMFRISTIGLPAEDGFPHASGDVPHQHGRLASGRWLSPREWGCSG